MIDRPATPTSGIRPALSDPVLRARPEPVAVLEGLLATLFPEPPSLDCITIDDILRRYPLTGLGAPALTAIEQSQRIVRARGDYGQAGLSEFHVGLIFLNWEDYRAAANQFALARQPWLLALDNPAMCLAHFAQGLALYHAFHNEPAMLHFGRTERMLKRALSGSQGERLAALAARLHPLLAVAQETLRVNLWPEDKPSETGRGFAAPPPSTGDRRPAARDTSSEAGARQSHERLAFARANGPGRRVPLPISNLPGGLGELPRGPVPGHIVVDDRFGWYIVDERTGDFLPGLAAGSWLLADREAPEPPVGRDYVIAGSRQPHLGHVTVQPVSHASAVPYCYAGYRDTGLTGSQLFLDETRRPVAAGLAVVLAVIEGTWLGLDGRALDGSPEGRKLDG